jgi:hypothetical protein
MLGKLAGLFFGLVFAASLIVGFSFLDGLAVYLLYGWFVIPVFHAMPSLGIWQAAGISLMIGYLTMQHIPEEPHPDEESLSEIFERSWPIMKWHIEVFLMVIFGGWVLSWLVPHAL